MSLVFQNKLRARFSIVAGIPISVADKKIFTVRAYKRFAITTRFLSWPCKQSSPSGLSSVLSGRGSGPLAWRISLARLLVPHGGPIWMPAMLSCCKMRHNNSSPSLSLRQILKYHGPQTVIPVYSQCSYIRSPQHLILLQFQTIH